MVRFHAHLKIFVATAPCDLRANFNGLWTAAQGRLGEDPKSGALLVFGNRRRNRIKLLYFDGTGVCVLARRFFGKKSEQLNAAQLELLLSGLAEAGVELTDEEEPPTRRSALIRRLAFFRSEDAAPEPRGDEDLAGSGSAAAKGLEAKSRRRTVRALSATIPEPSRHYTLDGSPAGTASGDEGWLTKCARCEFDLLPP